MNIQTMQQSIRDTVKRQGEQLKKATPTAIAISLASASLLPLILGSTLDASPALSILRELGVATLADFVANFIDQLREKYGGKKFEEKNVFADLETELKDLWQTDDDQKTAIRKDTSVLLKAVQAVDIAIKVSGDEIKNSLAQGFGELGKEFKEFGWMLDEMKDSLEEVRLQQAIQLATQKEQLELQREQLTKTNLLLKIQGKKARKPETDQDQEVAERQAPVDLPCPYKGLAPYQPQDAEDFAGRDELVMNIMARLAEANFLGVVGPSGSGKSSVVRAGVVPLLWKEGHLGQEAWETLITTPGIHPLEELAVRMSLMIGISPGSLIEDLKRDPKALRLAIKQYFAADEAGAGLCLILDQFEEVFTLCRDEGERNAYIEAILSVTTLIDMPVKLILILRADFYGRCAQFSKLSKLLSDNQTLVGKMSGDEFRDAIVQPAERVGLRLETGLVELLLEEIRGEAGALPMLSHALRETWKLRRGNVLTVEGYLETGCIRGAIAETAETIYQSLPEKLQEIARQIFLRLAEFEDENMATSRPSTLSEFITDSDQDVAIHQILEQLTQARLLTMDDEKVAVAHETLFTQWPALAKWLQEDMEGLRIYRHITDSAIEWDTMGQDSHELYQGARLAQALEWQKNNHRLLNALENKFISASQVYSTRKRRRATILITTIAFSFALLSLFSWGQKNQAVESNATAQAASTKAVYEKNIGATAQANAEEQSRIAKTNQVAAYALINLDERLDFGSLLAVQSFQNENNFQTRHALLSALQYSPNLLETHHQYNSSLAISPDGKLMAIADYDEILLWDLETQQQIGEPLSGHTGIIFSIDFSPDGLLLISGSSDETVRLWDLSTHTQFNETLDINLPVECVAFSPNGSVLAICQNDNILLWDIPTWQQKGDLLNGHSDWIRSIQFNPDGKKLVSGSSDGTVRLWDVQLGEQLGEALTGHTKHVNAIAISSDGSIIASGGYDRTIRIWDVSTGGQIGEALHGHSDSVYSISLNSDGTVLASGGSDESIRLWDIATMQQIGEPLYGHRDWISSIIFLPNEEKFVSGSGDDTFRVWGLDSGLQKMGALNVNGGGNGGGFGVNTIAFNSDGSHLASGSIGFLLWDIKNGERIIEPIKIGEVVGISFWENRFLMVTGYRSNDASSGFRLWDLNVGKQIGPELVPGLRNVSSYSQSTAINMNNSIFASGNGDGIIHFWDTQSGEIIKESMSQIIGNNSSIAFRSDGRILATGRFQEIRLWDIETEEQLGDAIQGFPDWVTSISFSADGSMIASGNKSGEIFLWDYETKQQIGKPIKAYEDDVASLAFSPDGSILASGGDDGFIYLWDISTDSWESIACQRAGRNMTLLEWETYFPEEPYEKTCPQWPAGE
jgi:WD40 repeat protein